MQMLTNLLREELQAFEKQIVLLEVSRESEYINGALTDKLKHCSSDLSGVSKEIHRYKDLYDDNFESSDDPWELVPRMSAIDRDSLDFPSRVTWDDDAGIDSSDSLENPYADFEQFAPLSRSEGRIAVKPDRGPLPNRTASSSGVGRFKCLL